VEVKITLCAIFGYKDTNYLQVTEDSSFFFAEL